MRTWTMCTSVNGQLMKVLCYSFLGCMFTRMTYLCSSVLLILVFVVLWWHTFESSLNKASLLCIIKHGFTGGLKLTITTAKNHHVLFQRQSMNNQSCYVDGLTNCCSKIIICRKSEHLKIKNSISLTSLTLRRAVWCLREGEVKLLLCEREISVS